MSKYDALQEAYRIDEGDTLLLPERRHIQALAGRVRAMQNALTAIYANSWEPPLTLDYAEDGRSIWPLRQQWVRRIARSVLGDEAISPIGETAKTSEHNDAESILSSAIDLVNELLREDNPFTKEEVQNARDIRRGIQLLGEICSRYRRQVRQYKSE